MSSSPFGRSRRSEGIIGVDALPAQAGFDEVVPRGVSSRLDTLSVGLFAIVLAVVSAGCAPSRPIAPVRAPTPDSTIDREFDADQRARLDRLRAALAESRSSSASSGLVVRLAFDEAADLDLFVTDPMQESVYFANSPTRSGGTLIDDRRCNDPSPRIEVVHYAMPTPGRYRVGVDFHRRCQDTSLSGDEEKQGLYVVRVDDGARVLEREGKVVPGQFEVIVIEFDYLEVDMSEAGVVESGVVEAGASENTSGVMPTPSPPDGREVH